MDSTSEVRLFALRDIVSVWMLHIALYAVCTSSSVEFAVLDVSLSNLVCSLSWSPPIGCERNLIFFQDTVF